MCNNSQKLSRIISDTYYNPSSPAAFSSCERLYTHLKKNGVRLSRKEASEWLRSQPTYSLHRDRRIKFKRNHYNITNIDDLWEMDLIDMQKYSRINKGNKYILAVIDCFSKFAWCITIKRKTPAEIIRGFDEIFSSTTRRPIKIQSDKGREFVNKHVKLYFADKDIQFFTTRDPATKAAICERFIRTIKNLIYKYFTYSKSNKYVDVIENLLILYNNRKHSSIGIAPANVNENNILQVWQYTQQKRKKSIFRSPPTLHVGDIVRISNSKSVFEKGYKPKWSTEKFSVVKVHRRNPVVYSIKDNTGTVITGNFYQNELQRID